MAQAQQSSIFSRKILNLFAGMAYGSPDLPPVLRDGGYVCHSVEPSFAVAVGKLINPELLLCSDVDHHTIVLEAKSGANLNTDQLERYSLLTADALVKQAFTTKEASSNHDILIVGREEYESRLLLGSATLPSDRRVIALARGLKLKSVPQSDDLVSASLPLEQVVNASDSEANQQSGLSVIENTFSTQRLNNAFIPELTVDWDLVPNNFLPVDHESENWEYAEYLIPELISRILSGEESISIEATASTFIRNWDFIATAYKNRLIERIRTILKLAAQGRFAPYMSYGDKGSDRDTVILKIPENLDTSQASVRGQLHRRFRELMDDLDSPQIAIVYED